MESTPLVLRLLVVEDRCAPGVAGWDLFRPVRAADRVSCALRVTAYFSSPLPVAETLAGILGAGERALSGIPFTRGTVRQDRPGELSRAGHTLTWDQPGFPVPWPGQSADAYRFVCEPPRATGTDDIRCQYGTVFALTLPPAAYFRMPR
ncbi:hypothetical protein OG349_33565 [Streptomyces sp. NBC_01317]|uniref:hypothetical protein n=1 Tax=Streptomyces sp. NBC_01317 TaxID=2903822 RepID=UPI002E0FC8BF|nr:hypothetical protein OG349_33565 [Streptomyces sp. NBC_01317]